ncbi:MAG: hypothetical protein WBB08_06525 [Halobacteriota archaeon]
MLLAKAIGLPFCFDINVLETVSMKLKTLGFNYVTLPLEGYLSGNMDIGKPHT